MTSEQLEEMADNLLNEVVRLREENERLKCENFVLKAPATYDELWENWNDDESEDCPEFFAEVAHCAEQYQRMLFWRLDKLKYKHWMQDRDKWKHQVQWGKDFLTHRDRWLHEPA
jgi:hypothetical protein